MYGRKVKLRFLFVVLILITLILTTFLVLKSLEENVVYFQSPSEIKALSELDKKKIRVGGMVKKNSISINSSELKFVITDFKNEINVTYTGAIPNLFEEGKGVVAEGVLNDRNFFLCFKNSSKTR
jgi:cytochrome c-type biogenesis protein CcmE